MKLNGIMANAVASGGTIGETVVKAVGSRGKSVLCAAPFDATRDRHASAVGCGLSDSSGPGWSQDSILATARRCRSFGDADTHFYYVGTGRPGNIAGRSEPVARGSGVRKDISRTGIGSAGTVSRQYAETACGCHGAGAARTKEFMAAEFSAANKTSSKHAAGLAASPGRRLHIA